MYSTNVVGAPNCRRFWFGKLNNMTRVIIECRAGFAGFTREKENLLNVAA